MPWASTACPDAQVQGEWRKGSGRNTEDAMTHRRHLGAFFYCFALSQLHSITPGSGPDRGREVEVQSLSSVG